MSSAILAFTKSIDTIDLARGTVQLSQAINIAPSATERTLRVLSASVSSNIPNVYTYKDFSNARINISKDNGATWLTVNMPDGVYSISHIAAAINSAAAVLTWWTTPSDPGFKLGVNAATDFVYLKIDSTKCIDVGAQLCIDFGSASAAHLLLGFTDPSVFTVDGLYAASNAAQMDWFGNRVQVLVEGFGSLSYKNADQSYEICSIPLSSSAINNEYLFPMEGTVSPAIHCDVPNCVRSYSVTFIGSRRNSDGSPRYVFIYDGDISLYMELSW